MNISQCCIELFDVLFAFAEDEGIVAGVIVGFVLDLIGSVLVLILRAGPRPRVFSMGTRVIVLAYFPLSICTLFVSLVETLRIVLFSDI